MGKKTDAFMDEVDKVFDKVETTPGVSDAMARNFYRRVLKSAGKRLDELCHIPKASGE